MKKIYKNIQKYFGRLSGLSENHSSHARLIAFFLGIILMGSAIWYTYQYFSTQSRATDPVVNYNLQSGNCKTESSASTCAISGKIGDTFKVRIYLESTEGGKLSGADFLLRYNIGKDGHVSYESQSGTAFGTTLVAETHADTLLHLTRVNDKNDLNLTGAEYTEINFKIQKEGTSRIALITSATTIVGPQTNDNGFYELSPQNRIGPKSDDPEKTWDNIYNIKVTSGNGTPPTTTTPGQTTPDPTISANPLTQIPVNLKDVPTNLRLRFQGITTQPKNSSPIKVKIKLVTGKVARKDYEEITFTPQGDGAYVADYTFKAVDINAEHSFLIKGPKHIAKRICKLNPTEEVGGTYRCKDSTIKLVEGGNKLDFTAVVLLAGDLPTQNGLIDSQDITFIRSHIGSSSSDVVASGDLNYDGIIDTQDYALIIKALSFKYDD
ncbi:hypothetical protein KBD81_06055 [Candidatus Woesebacteria bacterium]|nr:hypothetical protein [Candidatus Woesebacteria bacterium]